MAISGKVFFCLRVKVFLIRVLSHLGPWAGIRKVFLFKGLGAQKSFFVKGLSLGFRAGVPEGHASPES